ncbi:MAG: response regulator [Pseudomonadota bacterium]|nr:response regulator [Pseudomonadota bacterium]
MTRVLLIEDNEYNMDSLSRFLRRRNFDVLEARNAENGIFTAQKEQPDLILMDIGLPDMDGYHATQLIKANPKTAAIPVIALTAHAYTRDREQALEAGCADFHAKPIDPVGLVETIRKHTSDSEECEIP